MKLRILLLSLIFSLGLSACNPSANTSVPPAPASLTATEDPDGDGEDKGYTYFAMTRPATGKKVFIFDPNYDAWAVYDQNGNRVNVGKASGGRQFCPDEGNKPCQTIVGTFKIIQKKGADCKSHIFPIATHGGAPMPYCMRFDDGGFFIHGSNELPDYNASHGCIRVNPTAAKWLNQNFLDVGSTVIVLPYNKSS